MEIGNKIFELRKSAKMSQEQLAEKLNVTRQTISNWELGQTLPDIAQAKEIARIFSISLDELTDNDVKDILVERVANTEKSVGKAIKVLKGVLIAIICFIIISIFSVSLLAIENDIEKKQQKNEKVIVPTYVQEFYGKDNVCGCTYRIEYDDDNNIVNFLMSSGECENQNNIDSNNIYFHDIYNVMSKYDNSEQLITYIKKFYEEKGGTWEKIDKNHRYYIHSNMDDVD